MKISETLKRASTKQAAKPNVRTAAEGDAEDFVIKGGMLSISDEENEVAMILRCAGDLERLERFLPTKTIGRYFELRRLPNGKIDLVLSLTS